MSLIGVLLIDPFAPLAPGAWLSFGAVAIILLAVAGRVRRDGPITAFARVQAAVTVGLVPLLLAAFGSVSLISPLANAIAIPLFTLLRRAGRAARSVRSVRVVAGRRVGAGGSGRCYCSGRGRCCNGWPSARWRCGTFRSRRCSAFLALVVGALLLVAPGIWPTRLAGALLCLPSRCSIACPVPAVGNFELAMLDVGQGLAVVVRTHTHVLVYDAGPAFPTGRDAGELAVLPYLRNRGVRRVDTLVVSHGDLDHRGGVNSVLAGVPVAQVADGAVGRTIVASRARHAGAASAGRGTACSSRCLHPEHFGRASDNDSSCVLLVRSGAGSVLLAGDVEAAAESELVGGGLPRATVVVVPHHGSRTSSTATFVAASRPTLALVSAGYRNRWGLPRHEVVERWRAAGARVLTTADSGAIEISFAAGRPPLAREYRRTQRRYWHR